MWINKRVFGRIKEEVWRQWQQVSKSSRAQTSRIRFLDYRQICSDIQVYNKRKWVCQAWFTPGWKSAEWTWRWVDLWNNLGFNLCTALSVCHMVTTSDEESPSGSGYWLMCHCWIPEIKFNKSLSSSIIRLANYSVTTSLIYEQKV